MIEKTTGITDFDYNKEESYFTHIPSGFCLDGEFVLLFNQEDTVRLFAVASGGYTLSQELIEELRSIVRESKEILIAAPTESEIS